MAASRGVNRQSFDLRSRWRSVALLLLLFSLVLTGCWPLQDGSDPTNPVSPTPGPSGGLTAIPQAPGVLNIAGSTYDPPSLDPALASDSYSHFVIRQLFSGLVRFDNDLNIVPDIAASMPQVSEDGTVYTFVLRRGVLFPDGQEVTSTDFKYSIERAADPRLAGALPAEALPAGLYLDNIVGVRDKLAGAAQEISGVQAPDPYTLVITIDAPRQYFLSKLTAGPSYVVQRSNVESGDNWTDNPKGTGPFRLERWEHDNLMVLSANTRFYDGAPKLERVNIWMGSNARGQLQQYETGGLDVAGVGIDDLERVTDRNNPLSQELQSVPDLSITYLGFNIQEPPFDDPKVREAISRVIDRQRIARVMFQERVRQAEGFVPPDIAGYTPPETGDLGFDVTKARELLAESTYKGAENLPKLRLYSGGDPLGPMLREVLSTTLEIDLEVREVEWTDYLEGLDRDEYPMFLLTWVADYPDPAGILDSLFRSDSPGNHFGYRNDDVDAGLDDAAAQTDAGERLAEYTALEARVLNDFPAVPLFYSVDYRLVKPYVKGLQVTPMGILSLKDVTIDTR